MIKKMAILSSAALLLAACLKDGKVAVYADFTTDKDVYEVYEDIVLTNTSYAENAKIVASKWEWGNEHKWGLQLEEPISFGAEGEYEIKLTAVSDIGNVSSTCVKTVRVQDTNVRPVADFSFEPKTGLRAGDTVQFTDLSTDADGFIVGWEWRFGTTTVAEQNPEFTFTEFGDIEVSLTVTDNMKGTATKTVSIHVDKSVYSLELAWEQAYEKDKEAYVKFTSPATNADGSMVYALSSGYNLVAFTKDGEKKWTFDGNVHGADPYTTSTPPNKKSSTCTPAVDAEGNVIVALGYNEYNKEEPNTESGVFSVRSDGTEKWYFPFGWKSRYISVIPVIIGDHVLLTTKDNGGTSLYPKLENGHVIDRNTGAYVQILTVKQGNYGGAIGFADGKFICHCNDKYGSRIFFLENGTWRHYGDNDPYKSWKHMGRYGDRNKLESGASSQMAATRDGKVYVLYANVQNRVATNSVLYCYDTNKFVKDATTPFEPDWTVGISGETPRYEGLGVVCGEDGTIYVTTNNKDSERACVTAVSPEGSVKWTSVADGDIAGVAAVDNEGYIYYNDYTIGKLVKLSADGAKVSEIKIADELRSSPTISPDGTIYCTGMKNGQPTLFAVRGSATGHADSWSQSGGNPCKTGVLN